MPSIFLNCPVCNCVMVFDKERGQDTCSTCGGRVVTLPEPERSIAEGAEEWWECQQCHCANHKDLLKCSNCSATKRVARGALKPMVERYVMAIGFIQRVRKVLLKHHKPGNHATANERLECELCHLIRDTEAHL